MLSLKPILPRYSERNCCSIYCMKPICTFFLYHKIQHRFSRLSSTSVYVLLRHWNAWNEFCCEIQNLFCLVCIPWDCFQCRKRFVVPYSANQFVLLKVTKISIIRSASQLGVYSGHKFNSFLHAAQKIGLASFGNLRFLQLCHTASLEIV